VAQTREMSDKLQFVVVLARRSLRETTTNWSLSDTLRCLSGLSHYRKF